MTIAATEIHMRDGGCNVVEVPVHGKKIVVPAATVDDTTVVILRRWLRIATIKDEMFLEGDAVRDPEHFLQQLRKSGLRAHIFAFSQQLPDLVPRYDYHIDWDNLAVVAVHEGALAWETRLPQETRKNIRRAHRRGVTVRPVQLDDHFIKGVVEIYNESPLRQGKPFYHYGKAFDTIKQEISTFAQSCDFIGAYKDEELIGFVKLVYLGQVASIMHIVSKNSHSDSRPTNALIAEAVRHCSKKGIAYLVYGSYTYGRKTDSSLSQFKRRNGFEKVLIPRYYVPLTPIGKLIVALRLHRGALGLLPRSLISGLLAGRAKALEVVVALSGNPEHRAVARGTRTQPPATGDAAERQPASSRESRSPTGPMGRL